MSAHTPGPWTWFDYPDGRKLLAAPSRAVIHCPDAPVTCEPADARLIAAAPDLLDALRAFCGDYESTPTTRDTSLKAAYRRALDVIAKADGREP